MNVTARGAITVNTVIAHDNGLKEDGRDHLEGLNRIVTVKSGNDVVIMQ